MAFIISYKYVEMEPTCVSALSKNTLLELGLPQVHHLKHCLVVKEEMRIRSAPL